VRATGAWQQFWRILGVTAIIDLFVLQFVLIALVVMQGSSWRNRGNGAAVREFFRHIVVVIAPADGWNLVLVLASFIVALAIATLGVTRTDNELVRSSLEQLHTLSWLVGGVAINVLLAIAVQADVNPSFSITAGVSCVLIIVFASVAASRIVQSDTRSSLRRVRHDAIMIAQRLPRETAGVLRRTGGDERDVIGLPYLRYLFIYLGWHVLIVTVAVTSLWVAANMPFGSVHWTGALGAQMVSLSGELLIAWFFLVGLATIAAEGLGWLPDMASRRLTRIALILLAATAYAVPVTGCVIWFIALKSEPDLAIIACLPIVLSMIIPVSPLIRKSEGSKHYWSPRGASRYMRAAFRLRKVQRLTQRIEEQDGLFAGRHRHRIPLAFHRLRRSRR
jgi:hypothetical protein